MGSHIRRRDFLKSAPAAGALAYTVVSTACTPGGRPDSEAGAAEDAAGGGSPSASRPTGTGNLTAADVRIGSATYAPVKDYPIQPKSISEVTLRDAFWKPKVDRNATVTVPFEIRKIQSGRGLRGGVLEAAILTLQTHPDPWMQSQVDAYVRQTKATEEHEPSRSNRGFEIASTHYATTGERDLLDLAVRSADLIYEDFVRNSPPFSGGERDAVNCVQLYRVTGDKKHLDMAKHYLDIRGLSDSVNRSRHNQSYMPPVEQSEAVGHAVNCATLMVSLADVGVLTGIPEYLDAALRMWQDAAGTKMYVTGGIGSTGNEGFGEPYSLPNISAYSETCAVLMFITLNHRLFMATGDGKYIDVMERGMYNNALSGVSDSGDHFFYVNRLASAGDGRDLRWQHASLECCPPNLVRFMASMPQFIYAQGSDDAIFVNLYVSSETSFEVGGENLTLTVDSELPWDGASTIRVGATGEVAGSIKLRIPGWARNRPDPEQLYTYVDPVEQEPAVSVNGSPVSATADPKGYVTLDRTWRDGDVIEVTFPMEIRRVAADDRVRATRGRTAVERGPIVYTAEWPDAPDGNTLTRLLEPGAPLAASADPHLFGGVTVLTTEVKNLLDPSQPARAMRLIPYYLWANRGAGEMTVWLSSEPYRIGDVGPAGGYIFYENPDHAEDGWRYLEAAPFDQSAGAKWGCFRRHVPGANGTAIGTGRGNTRDILAACSQPGTAAYVAANLTVNGIGGWFLPSTDELVAMYRNLKAANVGRWGDAGLADNFTYWASSQNTTDMAAHVDFADLGRVHGDDKDFPRRVRAIRAI